jgi:hypothetical protein
VEILFFKKLLFSEYTWLVGLSLSHGSTSNSFYFIYLLLFADLYGQ